MTPAEVLSKQGFVTDPVKAASILEAEFPKAEPTEFDVDRIKTFWLWENYPRQIHPHMVVAWLISKGWQAQTFEVTRGKQYELRPMILVDETYRGMFAKIFKSL